MGGLLTAIAQPDKPQFESPAQAIQQQLTLRHLAGQATIQQQMVQENALKIAAAQKQQQAETDLAGSVMANTKLGDDGKYKLDSDAVMQDLLKKGHSKQAYLFDTDMRAHAKSVADQATAHLTQLGKMHEMQASAIDAIRADAPKEWENPTPVTPVLGEGQPVVNTEVDPQKIVALKASAQQQLQQLQANGAIANPAEVKPLTDFISNPTKENYQALLGFQKSKISHADNVKDLTASLEQVKTELGIQDARIKQPGEQADVDIKLARAAAYKNLTPKTIDSQIDVELNPDKYSDPHIKEQVRIENETAKAAAHAALPDGYKAVQDAIKDSADRISRLASSVAGAGAKAPITIHVAAANAAGRQAATLGASGLTDDDIMREGQKYAISGDMPQMGMGSSVIRTKILHAANEYARESGMTPREMLLAKAAWKGDTASLAALQKQRDQIVSFENTAKKNLDLFLTSAAQIPDTGIPWLNKPLRELDEKLVGSANMAAVNAARQVANNEIAKVTSGGGLGGVLSDAARKEVADYNPKSATFAQTMKVAQILTKDMDNRHSSLDNSLSEIRGRMAGGAPTAQTATQPATAAPVKYFTKADIDAAVASHPGMTAKQVENGFIASGWTKK